MGKLLIVTQKINRHDPVLGFFHEWVKAFAGKFEHISVIALEVGPYELPENVSVYSLGKEARKSRLTYLWRFFTLSVELRKEYGGVLVHMNQEYILLGALLWKALGKKVVLWYNHTAGSFLTDIAMALSNVICHTSPYAYTARSKKSRRMPAGVLVDRFRGERTKKDKSILSLGRIAPLKKVKEIIQAALLLDKSEEAFTLDVYGDALPSDQHYKKEIEAVGISLIQKEKLRIFPGVTNEAAAEIFGTHEVFVNLTPAGNYDKTVLEAAVAGALPVVWSPAFSDLIPPILYAKENDVEDLKDTLKRVLALDPEKKKHISEKLKTETIRRHAISKLSEDLASLYHE